MTASDAAADDLFSTSVSIVGATIVVGANGDDCATGDFCGSAYVFEKTPVGWSGTLTESVKLTASQAAVQDSFGSAVSITANCVVVGATRESQKEDCENVPSAPVHPVLRGEASARLQPQIPTDGEVLTQAF